MDEYVLKAEAIGKAVKSLMDECADMTTDALAHVFRLGQASKSPIIWRTKSGHDVEILHTAADMNYPIVGLFVDRHLTGPYSWREDGGFLILGDAPYDLIIPDGFTVGAPDKTEAGEVK